MIVILYSPNDFSETLELASELEGIGIDVETRLLPEIGRSAVNESEVLLNSEAVVTRIIEAAPDAIIVCSPDRVRDTALVALSESKVRTLGVFRSPNSLTGSNGYRALFFDDILYNSTVVPKRLELSKKIHYFPGWAGARLSPTDVTAILQSPSTGIALLSNTGTPESRAKYYKIDELGGGVAIHGETGTDYRRLGGGTLSNQLDLIAISARYRASIFFDDGDLSIDPDGNGFSRFPKEVIQSLSVGLPIVVISERDEISAAGSAGITVVRTLAQAKLEVESWSQEKLLGERRAAFDKYAELFCPELRASQLARILGLQESKGEPYKLQCQNLSINSESLSETSGLLAWNRWFLRDSILNVPAYQGKQLRILAVVGGEYGISSRERSLLRTLDHLGHEVRVLEKEQADLLLARDPRKVCKFVLDLGKVQSLGVELDYYDILLTIGLDVAIEAPIKAKLADADVRTIHFDDGHSLWGVHLGRLAGSFDVVCTASRVTVEIAQELGFGNVLFIPYFINTDLKEELTKLISEKHPIVKVRRSLEREYELAPGLGVDGGTVPDDNIHHFLHLKTREPELILERLNSEMLLLSHEGFRENPQYDEVMPIAALSTDLLVFPRTETPERLLPYSVMGLNAREIGELSSKFDFLKSSPYYRKSMRVWKSWGDSILTSGIPHMASLLGYVFREKKAKPFGGLATNTRFVLNDHVVRDATNTDQVLVGVHLDVAHLTGSLSDWKCVVSVGGKIIYEDGLMSKESFAFLAHPRTTVVVEAVYKGASLKQTRNLAVKVTATISDSDVEVQGLSAGMILG
ncbi:hypothetical protein CPHO_03650 [Corynebacterium phocae]|uniref:Uncharacterized protein n=1 Tax=Corynebacterium phocae TaxID=161895 RepID=A0A1L7D278_9CORY|nr:hypothetical protein [Corynebacterium phocae]APT92132.1 hypothetical protein CPHO_03650 [Corynebacterium phocae]KAA8726522.1 hypothetical protein F4V58_03200 [Corynebacterium phocae]